jgi:arylsulfatase A-like enzyme
MWARDRRDPRVNYSRAVVFSLARTLAAVVVVLAGCRNVSDQPTRPNVIVYLVDTLRSDHLGVYGYNRDTSTALDAFARDAVVFDRAYSPSAWTRPACASLLTGLNPQRHRAMTREDTLGTEIELLSEHLQALDYRTAGVVSNPNVIALWGFDQGFDWFEDVPAATHHARADVVNEAVFRRLNALGVGPFFLYVHTMDPHGPFDPPPPFDVKYPRHRKRAIRPSRILPGTPRSIVEDAVSAYDGEIAFTDLHFGRLLDRLKADGLYESALIVFAADHGEELHDHGGGGHGHTLFQELVRVPLLVKLPANAHAGRRVETSVSLIDVVPTILGLLGVKQPDGLDGIDLLPLVRSEPALTREQPLYMHLDVERADGARHVVRGVLHGAMKYLHRLAPVEEEMLFDVEKDPSERDNRLAADPVAAEALARMLDAYAADTATGVHVRLINAGDERRRTCEGRLRTEGRFVDLSTRMTEAGDRIRVATDGRGLDFLVVLQNRPHPTDDVSRWIVDEDRFAFRTEPADAEITVERLSLAADEPFPLRIGPQRRLLPALPFTFDPTAADWTTPDVVVPMDDDGTPLQPLPMGAYVGVVPTAEQPRVPDAVQERLRALGYVGPAKPE